MRYDSEHVIELGRLGEEAVEFLLVTRGYRVESCWWGTADLVIEGVLTVEIKTALPSERGGGRQHRWQFCLYPHPGRDKPFDEDLLILRCEASPPVHFIIPGIAIPHGLTKIDITSDDPRKYRGKWSEFLEAWDVIDKLIEFTSRGEEYL